MIRPQPSAVGPNRGQNGDLLPRKNLGVEGYGSNRPVPSELLGRGIRDDERDDALPAKGQGESNIWMPSDFRRLHPSASPTLRHSIPRQYLLKSRQVEQANWRHGLEWYHTPRRDNSEPFRSLARQSTGGMVPVSHDDAPATRSGPPASFSLSTDNAIYTGVRRSPWSRRYASHQTSTSRQLTSSNRGGHSSFGSNLPLSRIIIPSNVIIPRELASPASDADSAFEQQQQQQHLTKRLTESWVNSPPPSAKRVKSVYEPLEGRFDKLDLLCSATLELGPLQDNPSGCSCPKSKCVALYCDCFKAGRRCSPTTCTCLNCKNTIEESGPGGARSKAIQAIHARNPRAFTSAGAGSAANKIPPGEQACNCIRSRCLKLYCTCFQVGRVCNAEICTCVGCLNTEVDIGGRRQLAIQCTLEKRPDAFQQKKKTKDIGAGCACKNNRCVRKYCECFRTNLACTKKCSCRDCENLAES